MGGIPGDVPGGAGRGPGQLGADGAAVGVPQESPRSEETDACENQWGEDQACCDGENIKSPRKVCKLTRLEGWHRPPYGTDRSTIARGDSRSGPPLLAASS